MANVFETSIKTSLPTHGNNLLNKPVENDIQIDMMEMSKSCPKVPTSRESQQLFCYKCEKLVMSTIAYQMGKGSYLVVLIFLVAIITAPLSIIPCVYKGWQDAQHKCPFCQSLLGTKLFLFG